MTTLVKDAPDTVIRSQQDLVDYLLMGGKPQKEWGIGIETEMLSIDSRTGEAAPFERIESLFKNLSEKPEWKPIFEHGRIIAIKGERSSLTLEPGGQVELSGRLCPDLDCCLSDYAAHVTEIVGAAAPMGLSFLGLGVHPFSLLDKISWVPKDRYAIMAPYMLKQGDMGQRMMKQTASLQVNLDFSDETDCIEKFRVAQALSPLLYAIFANSPLMEGRPTGFLSTRGEIWSRTDPERTGLLYRMFDKDADLGTYVDYALDVPMYFIFRDGNYLDFTSRRITFRRFLSEGFEGYRASLRDWDLHLSTLFPEVRLRPQIEIRSIDSLPPRYTLAPAVLLKGVIYDRDALAETWALFEELAPREWETLYHQSWKLGLKTPLGRRTLREAGRDLLDIARSALQKKEKTGEVTKIEVDCLDLVGEIVEGGRTLAERLVASWTGGDEDRLSVLKRLCAYEEWNVIESGLTTQKR